VLKTCEGSHVLLSQTIQQESNARINRAGNIERSIQADDDMQADSAPVE
jgi:hypothetical protein